MAIAIDAMGGDTPLVEAVDAAVRAINDFDQEVVLVGDEHRIRHQLEQYRYDASRLEVVHTTEVVEMYESPANALRQKKDSSIRVAVNLIQQGKVDAMLATVSHT